MTIRRAGIVVVWLALPVIGVLMFHSAHRKGSSVPQLETDEWQRIRVVYLAQVGTNRQATAWSTEDTRLLQSLRESLRISSVTELYSPGLMKNNRIDLTLCDDERWMMAINKKALYGTALLVHAPSNPKRSFSMRIASDFVQALEHAVEASTGQKVDLDAPSDNLVGPSAAEFRSEE